MTTTEEIEELAGQEYKFGFVTDIEQELIPKGLDEDVVRLISSKKDEPEWLLLHRIGPIGRYAEAVARGEQRYRLVRVAPYSDLSGWHWLVYRREPALSGSGPGGADRAR